MEVWKLMTGQSKKNSFCVLEGWNEKKLKLTRCRVAIRKSEEQQGMLGATLDGLMAQQHSIEFMRLYNANKLRVFRVLQDKKLLKR